MDAGADFSILRHLVKKKVKALICIGRDNTRLIETFRDLDIPFTETMSMEEAAEQAFFQAKSGDAVLLSPACPSFDLYRGYEDRGNEFRKAVKNL